MIYRLKTMFNRLNVIWNLKSDSLIVFITFISGSAKWSVSLPTTMTGQPVAFSAYRGLWKQCYGSGGTGNSFQVSYQATSILLTDVSDKFAMLVTIIKH